MEPTAQRNIHNGATSIPSRRLSLLWREEGENMNGNIRQCFKNGSPLKPFGLKQNYGNSNLAKSCRYKTKKEQGEFFTMHKGYGNKI